MHCIKTSKSFRKMSNYCILIAWYATIRNKRFVEPLTRDVIIVSNLAPMRKKLLLTMILTSLCKFNTGFLVCNSCCCFGKKTNFDWHLQDY